MSEQISLAPYIVKGCKDTQLNSEILFVGYYFLFFLDLLSQKRNDSTDDFVVNIESVEWTRGKDFYFMFIL